MRTFSVVQLSKLLISRNYTENRAEDGYITFTHNQLPSIRLVSSGAYQEWQVKSVVMEKMGVNNYTEFCRMHNNFK